MMKRCLRTALAATLVVTGLAGAAAAKPVCATVDARQGWQVFTLPAGTLMELYADGAWSVDARNYADVGPSGHQGDDALRLAPYNQYKYVQDYDFGVLLFGVPGERPLSYDDFYMIFAQPTAANPLSFGPIDIEQPTNLAFRINDSDETLGDNSGSMRVCMDYL